MSWAKSSAPSSTAPARLIKAHRKCHSWPRGHCLACVFINFQAPGSGPQHPLSFQLSKLPRGEGVSSTHRNLTGVNEESEPRQGGRSEHPWTISTFQAPFMHSKPQHEHHLSGAPLVTPPLGPSEVLLHAPLASRHFFWHHLQGCVESLPCWEAS